ncbi:MAG: hypothetical protein IH599_04965, partial [Bacteroidales bacterium]|nr:hypothetical protein [Bacteroidales bacterium]
MSLVALTLNAQVPAFVPDSGLVAWYPFNGNADDGSGDANHGAVQGTLPAPDRFGQNASAYYFPGTNEKIVCPNDTAITNARSLSVAAWFKVENRPGGWDQNVLLSNIGPYASSGGFQIITGNPPNTDVSGMFRNTSFADQVLSGSGLATIDTGQWYHVVLTLDYNTAGNNTLAKLYLNGSPLTSHTFNSYIVYQNITPFLIGLNIDSIGFQRSYKGCLDDIGLWNRPLSPQEVVTLYQAPQQVPDSLLHLKAFLQAAWRTGHSLAPSLISGGLLPSVQPYNVLPWSYTGTESVSPLPVDMVDWVLVELRTTTDTVIERRAAGLRTDGMLLDTNGLPGLRFTSPPGNYHIAIQHRNHLPVMTREKVAIPGFMLYDFTDTTQLPLFGGCVITTTSGAEAMIAGDLNHDGILKYSGSANDSALVFQRILLETGSTSLTTTLNGYFPEDIRMDGTVKYSGLGNDPSMIIQNLITLKGSTIITTTYSGCAPIPYIILPPVQTFQQCGDTLTDMRDGKKYPTVPIGTQCWMAKNLNVGTMVNSVNTGSNHSDMSNNGIIEKYCYSNDTNLCSVYGGLYDWNEMMGYVTTSAVQGICPSGWHIPTDAEWCNLTTFLDASVNCSIWG